MAATARADIGFLREKFFVQVKIEWNEANPSSDTFSFAFRTIEDDPRPLALHAKPVRREQLLTGLQSLGEAIVKMGPGPDRDRSERLALELAQTLQVSFRSSFTSIEFSEELLSWLASVQADPVQIKTVRAKLAGQDPATAPSTSPNPMASTSPSPTPGPTPATRPTATPIPLLP